MFLVVIAITHVTAIIIIIVFALEFYNQFAHIFSKEFNLIYLNCCAALLKNVMSMQCGPNNYSLKSRLAVRQERGFAIVLI